ncbi:MAG TPA: NAD(+)/NADH kinase [Chloroflexia bacterium]|nr:NAD(+)/NADH kinase [Chloroflexia bacterium]
MSESVLKNVGVVLRPNPPQEADELSRAFTHELEGHGVNVWRGTVPDSGEFEKKVKELDLVFVFGGDGTILHAAKIAAYHGVPITGVDFGRFGFLAELDPRTALDKVPDFVHGKHWLEERAMLKAQLVRHNNVVGEYLALNDIVVGRSFLSGVIDVKLDVDGSAITTYIGDGLIVSTATGSTAYLLATGGPVIAPTMRVIAISAIAPHLSHLSHLIVPESSVVTLYVGTRKGASVTIDGQPDFSILDKDVLNVSNAPHVAYFARLQPKSYFYATLATRLRRGG